MHVNRCNFFRGWLGSRTGWSCFIGIVIFGSSLFLAGGEEAEGEQATASPVRVTVRQVHMGMLVHLTVYAPDTAFGQAACKQAFRRIREVNLALSDYEPGSELSRLCRRAGQGPVEVSDDLFRVLEVSLRMAALTAGRFDPTAAPVIRLWRQARKEGRLPVEAALREAHALVDWKQIRLDADRKTVELLRPGMLLDLGAIGKGYAGDEALRVLKAEGCPGAVFEAGGDLVFGDPPPGQTGWLVETPDAGLPPRRFHHLARSVSGDTRQFLEVDGLRYSHVVDAVSGQGLTGGAFCVVEAPLGLYADPLSTIGTLLPESEFRTLVDEHFPGVKVQVLHPDPSPAGP